MPWLSSHFRFNWLMEAPISLCFVQIHLIHIQSLCQVKMRIHRTTGTQSSVFQWTNPLFVLLYNLRPSTIHLCNEFYVPFSSRDIPICSTKRARPRTPKSQISILPCTFELRLHNTTPQLHSFLNSFSRRNIEKHKTNLKSPLTKFDSNPAVHAQNGARAQGIHRHTIVSIKHLRHETHGRPYPKVSLLHQPAQRA